MYWKIVTILTLLMAFYYLAMIVMELRKAALEQHTSEREQEKEIDISEELEAFTPTKITRDSILSSRKTEEVTKDAQTKEECTDVEQKKTETAADPTKIPETLRLETLKKRLVLRPDYVEPISTSGIEVEKFFKEAEENPDELLQKLECLCQAA